MLGERIALLRWKQGISQAALADRLHISASTVGMYEQGRRAPSLDMVVRLAREFGVTTDYLLTGQTPDGASDYAEGENMEAIFRLVRRIVGQ